MWDKHENNRQQSKKYKREWQWRNDNNERKNRGENRIKNDKEQCEKSVIRISVNEKTKII